MKGKLREGYQTSVQQRETSNLNIADSRGKRHASHVCCLAFWCSSGSFGSVVLKNFMDYVSPLSDSIPGGWGLGVRDRVARDRAYAHALLS